ncbi:MAG: hypothetical protein LUO93_06415 [Methanomicrobiales archaeon]|nr:hypothetical protein [Methanomicrobiales archaeon]
MGEGMQCYHLSFAAWATRALRAPEADTGITSSYAVIAARRIMLLGTFVAEVILYFDRDTST